MMDYPFYRNYYYPVREVPAPIPARRETAPQNKVIHVPQRKVIHVPVINGSQKRSRSKTEYAVMIQKVLRGFLVRKSVKKIAAIKTEVDEMEKRIVSKETMESIRKDSKERLKINEMLMRLLLKLDSVRGVDSGVRDCRKAVIKKAIRLQEVVDSIADQALDQAPELEGTASKSDRNSHSNSNSDSNTADRLQNNCEPEVRDIPESVDVDSRGDVELNEEEDEDALEVEVGGNVAKSASESNTNLMENNVDPNLELKCNVESSPDVFDAKQDEEAVNDFAVSMELSQDESQTGSSANPKSLIEGDEHEHENDGGDSDTSEKHENGDGIEKDEMKEGNQGKNIQLLEKLVEENEKMMGLMADLFKKNEMQTQLLSSLSHRVEHLERVLMCEKFRRKKKRNGSCF